MNFRCNKEHRLNKKISDFEKQKEILYIKQQELITAQENLLKKAYKIEFLETSILEKNEIIAELKQQLKDNNNIVSLIKFQSDKLDKIITYILQTIKNNDQNSSSIMLLLPYIPALIAGIMAWNL